MRIPTIHGSIKRRILVNFRADAGVVKALLPAPFRPKLHEGKAIVGVCLIRLEQIRPIGLPGFLGISSENAAHRIAVEWTEKGGTEREGVFIPRRDTGSLLNRMAGGRLFPGEHCAATFVVKDDGATIDFRMKSDDSAVEVRLVGQDAIELPKSSIFRTVRETSQFFEGGSLGYSVTSDVGRLDGLTLRTKEWRVAPLEVNEVFSSWFDDTKRFPKGSVEFDHALIMRDIAHEWHVEKDLRGQS